MVGFLREETARKENIPTVVNELLDISVMGQGEWLVALRSDHRVGDIL